MNYFGNWRIISTAPFPSFAMNPDALTDQLQDPTKALPTTPYRSDAPPRLQIREGLPFPLGATWDGQGVNFALFSGHAKKVELCLFDRATKEETQRLELPEFTDEVWHGYVSGLHPGTLYGFRVHGPYSPEEGHRFNQIGRAHV